MAHANCHPSRFEKAGMSGIARENVPNPVMLSRPTKMSAPTPAASRPGTRTTPSRGPPSPAISIRRKAPRIGEPSNVLTAAKLPAAPMTTLACAGASFLTRWTTSTARPLPIAMSGASGPSTTPLDKVTNEAMTMPGSMSADGAPSDLNPSAGSWPPVPGR